MDNLKIKGSQEFMGINIPVIEGGFGEDKKCICDKTIAEIHGMNTFDVRRRITDNIKRFKENIDFIDLKEGMCLTHTSENRDVSKNQTLDFALELGYTKSAITQAKHIYLLSERGYAKLIKIMDTDLAWEIHDRLIDEYFTMREIINSDEQLKAKLLLSIYSGGQEGILASKKLTDLEVEAATAPLLSTIDTQSKTIEQQDNKLQIQKPFVQAALQMQNTEDYKLIRETAKLLCNDGVKIGEKKLFALLREHNILMGNNEPYQKYINLGLFVVKLSIIDTKYGTVKTKNVTLVTGKGLIFLNKKVREWLGMEEADVDLEEFNKKLEELQKKKEEKELHEWLDNM